MLRYPVQLQKADDGITVTFPDFPFGVSCGETQDEALLNAVDAIEEIIAALIRDKQDIPKPSAAKRRHVVTLSPAFSAKVLLYNALREQHMTKAELARRLNWKCPQVDRLFDTHHQSQLSQLVSAAAVLGKTFVIGMEDARSR
ncbi:MAG: type II toxin-antitoxin system HicB family antitoxin [Gammaproteobacteria bacterium]|nr:type II toxin-antitoxin system HicB family antitoxin [Gammaproteobacteria bacterium]